jgi:hypothetical protein
LHRTPSALYLEQLDAALVMDFLAHLEAERGNSPRTRNARLAAIKAFMKFVEYRVPSSLERRKPISPWSIISRWPRCTPFWIRLIFVRGRAYEIGP